MEYSNISRTKKYKEEKSNELRCKKSIYTIVILGIPLYSDKKRNDS